MRKTVLLQSLLVFFSINLFSQRECIDLPTSRELLVILKNRPFSEIDFDHLLLNKKCNVNDTLKKRLVHLVKWQWTKTEINHYVSESLKENYDGFEIESNAKNISKGNNAAYIKAVDSLVRFWKQYILRHMNENDAFFVSSQIVLSVCYLDMKETIPLLQKARTDSLHYDRDIVELGLARLGDKTSQARVLAKNKYTANLDGREWLNANMETFSKLIFMASQQSVYQIHEWLDPSKTFNPLSEGDSKEKCSVRVLGSLFSIIKNKDFQDLVKAFPESASAVTDAIVYAFKQWLIKNKGSYIIDRNAAYYYRY